MLHKKQDNMCSEFSSETTVTTSQQGPFYDVRHLPLGAVSEDSHLMPITIYQVCCPNSSVNLQTVI